MKISGQNLLAVAWVVGGLAALGCGTVSETTSSNDPYRVERRSENGAEVVRTLSGWRWGGRATLVEELSIGEETGEEPYLFGSITAAWATDNRIYVVDAQVPAVRAFDLRGQHLFDLGGPGQGPGEFGAPAAIAVTEERRVLVADTLGARIDVYEVDTEHAVLVEDWPSGSPKSALGLTLGQDGQVYTQSWSVDEERLGMQAVGPDGPTGELLLPPLIAFEPPTVSVGKGLEIVVPLAPAYSWAFAPGGEIVAGVGNQYRFEIHRAGGKTTVVERASEPVSVEPREADFLARLASSTMRQMSPDLGMRSADVPTHKAAFSGFYPDRIGRVWVIRQGPGRPDPECSDAAASFPSLMISSGIGDIVKALGKGRPPAAEAFPGGCWPDTVLFDVFELATGDFLGTVDSPDEGLQALLFADAETVLAVVADESGTLRVKKYRLQIEEP